ncbi:MAG: hypothetical protein LBD86_02695 [Spirochaetaceae bacterium]|jgi:hypothetical protein|nr:hypothetical protein [Spirochaetaceae bacterium]
MGKKVYEPGELDNVKKRLGPIDEKEAKRMQRLLGGEVGEEKTAVPDAGYSRHTRPPDRGKNNGLPPPSRGTAAKPKRLVELAPADGKKAPPPSRPKFRKPNTPSYSERVKMDRCASSNDFEIKSMGQVFISVLSFFKTPHDKVNPWFVKSGLDEYYAQLEHLVTSTRLLFPRSNTGLGRKLQNLSPTAFAILNTIRQWKIDVISEEIARFQSRPRNVFVSDFEIMLREIYRPIYIMENLDSEKDIRTAFLVLHDIILNENPGKGSEKLNTKIEEMVKSWRFVCLKLRYLLYPLLMKTISSYYHEYELFFTENSENYRLFLGLEEADRISASYVKTDNVATHDGAPDGGESESIEDFDNESAEDSLRDIDDTGQSDRDRLQEQARAEAKAFGRGLQILKTLFPQAPWDKIEDFPDFYPYFADVFEIKKNGELIAPEDPAHLALILSQAIEELLYGFRYIKFVGASNASSLNEIVDDWHAAVSESFEKKYLPLIYEYAHYFEYSAQKKNSTYAVNIAADIHWVRRYYFLPNYGYTPPTPPSFLKKDVIALYAVAHRLRRDLAECAVAIGAAQKEGGAAKRAVVTGIENPWSAYNFQVENPLSKRLNILLGKNQRNNAALIFFTFAIVTVLDSYLCDKNSVAYRTDAEILFRNSGTDKLKPIFWVDKQKDTFLIFKKSVEDVRKTNEGHGAPQ